MGHDRRSVQYIHGRRRRIVSKNGRNLVRQGFFFFIFLLTEKLTKIIRNFDVLQAFQWHCLYAAVIAEHSEKSVERGYFSVADKTNLSITNE